MLRRVLLGLLTAAVCAAAISACATRPPSQTQNICDIFREKRSWYKAAAKSRDRWGTPIQVQMAIIKQESTFRFNAKPPRKKLLGVVPWKRKSSAYGYAQVKDETWDWYRSKTGRRGADRDDFSDAIDFVGWYTNLTQKSTGVSKWDGYGQYLAYHEGHGGYKRRTFANKAWLIDTAQRVDANAKEYGAQLKRCENSLKRKKRFLIF